MRKTKIIATIGPASSDSDTLDRLVGLGLDCVRLNFSHGTLEEHGRIIRKVRELSEKYRRPVSVLQDLGGIKLRLGQMAEPVQLVAGDEVYLVPEDSSDKASVLPFPQPEVLRSLQPGNLVYLSDGTVCLEVVQTQDSEVKTKVLNASATLSSYKGVNLPGVAIDQPVLTEDDKVALRYGVEAGVDWVAVSFVRSVEDIHYAKDFLNSIGSTAPIMAKLERREGIENIAAILEEVDGVMVARGDLGVEIPMERVPIVQKNIVKQANEVAKVSVIATQMLRSMVVSPNPTRAEISDITNAVLDGCDAILLSEETAVGDYPVEAVKVAQATILEAETVYPYYRDFDSGDRTQSIASAAGHLVQELNSKPIVITSAGRAAYAIARSRPDRDILVFSHDEAVLRRLCLGWGLYPMGVIPPERDVAKLVSLLVQGCLNSGMVLENDVVTIVHGFLPGVSGTTNTIQVLDMWEYLNRSS
jgi:pyruvate kinase